MLLFIEVKNVNIFYFYSQSLLKSLASRVMKTFISWKFGSNMVLAFASGISLTIFLACIYLNLTISSIISFGLTINSIDFWRLIGSNVDFWYCFLFLLLFLELIDLKNKCSSLSNNWTSSNVSFPSKSSSIEYVFADLSL